MVSDNKAIKENGNRLFVRMKGMNYSFSDLQALGGLSGSDLCLALIQLIRENKVEQCVEEGTVYYRKKKSD